MRNLYLGVCVALAMLFLVAFGFFAFVEMWELALWSMGASIVAITCALVISAETAKPKP